MPHQYVREPFTAEESDRLSNACKTPIERLAVATSLDNGYRVGALYNPTPKDVLGQRPLLRFKAKGGPSGEKIKVRLVPMSNRVRALLEHHLAPVKMRSVTIKVAEYDHLPPSTALGPFRFDEGRAGGRPRQITRTTRTIWAPGAGER
jgi:integrase